MRGVVRVRRLSAFTYEICGAYLCSPIVHRVLPLIRLKHGAGPIRVMMLGLPLDGLSKDQVATVREEADALEALVVGMRVKTKSA